MWNRAFSLFEVLLYIVIVGIFVSLGYVLYPHSKLHLAKDQIEKHIQHTKYLALQNTKEITQDKFCKSDFCIEEMRKYEQSFYRIQFSKLKDIGWSYSIFSDSARDSKTKNFDDRPMDSFEIARSPIDSKFLSVYNYNNSKFANTLRDGNLAISSRYGIIDIKITGGCGNSNRILFNDFGFLVCKPVDIGIHHPKDNVILEIFDKFGSEKICITKSGDICGIIE